MSSYEIKRRLEQIKYYISIGAYRDAFIEINNLLRML